MLESNLSTDMRFAGNRSDAIMVSLFPFLVFILFLGNPKR